MDQRFEAFKKYTSHYDCQDKKIALKIKHTYHVAENMMFLAKSLNLPPLQSELAFYTALYHDIGRFEQVCRYGTFVDAQSVDHAKLGVQILEESDLLPLKGESRRQVLSAIANHNRFEIEPGLSGFELLLCQMIRDADKIDIFRVFAQESFEEVCGRGIGNISEQIISIPVAQAIFEHRCVNKADRKTLMDIVVTFLGFFFDFYFDASLRMVSLQGYWRQPLEKLPLKNEDTKRQLLKMMNEIEQYVHKRLQQNEELA